MAPPLFEIVHLERRAPAGGGHPYWVAEVTAGGLRLGADTVFGSWLCYEVTDGGPLRSTPGAVGTPRREIAAVAGLTALPSALQREVARRESASSA